jgi:hypothetical protein
MTEPHPWYGPCDDFADGQCAACLLPALPAVCIICGESSESPLCYRAECLEKWKDTMKGKQKP